MFKKMTDATRLTGAMGKNPIPSFRLSLTRNGPKLGTNPVWQLPLQMAEQMAGWQALASPEAHGAWHITCTA